MSLENITMLPLSSKQLTLICGTSGEQSEIGEDYTLYDLSTTETTKMNEIINLRDDNCAIIKSNIGKFDYDLVTNMKEFLSSLDDMTKIVLNEDFKAELSMDNVHDEIYQ